MRVVLRNKILYYLQRPESAYLKDTQLYLSEI